MVLLDRFRLVPEIWRPVLEDIVLLLKALEILEPFILCQSLFYEISSAKIDNFYLY